jgi:hypothetical protein
MKNSQKKKVGGRKVFHFGGFINSSSQTNKGVSGNGGE